MLQIDLGIDACFLQGIQEVRDQWYWVSVFLHYLVKSSEVDAESERPIFLLDKRVLVHHEVNKRVR